MITLFEDKKSNWGVYHSVKVLKFLECNLKLNLENSIFEIFDDKQDEVGNNFDFKSRI